MGTVEIGELDWRPHIKFSEIPTFLHGQQMWKYFKAYQLRSASCEKVTSREDKSHCIVSHFKTPVNAPNIMFVKTIEKMVQTEKRESLAEEV